MNALASDHFRRLLFNAVDAAVYPLQDIWQSRRQLPSSAVVNQTEIRFVGMRRTGNHALLNWLMHQFSGEVYLLNNIVINKNPYQFKADNLMRYYPEHHAMAQVYRRQAAGELIKRDCLFYSYEDWSLAKIARSRVERNRHRYLGKSAQHYDILILRDPFNLFASRLKKKYVPTMSKQISMVALWLEYAKEFIGESHYLNRNLVCINYNRWFADESYRRQLSGQQSFPFSDAGLFEVATEGDGSSFDGTRFSGQARSKEVTNRWRQVLDDPAYRQLFTNEEIWTYSQRIFGEIPGTEALR